MSEKQTLIPWICTYVRAQSTRLLSSAIGMTSNGINGNCLTLTWDITKQADMCTNFRCNAGLRSAPDPTSSFEGQLRMEAVGTSMLIAVSQLIDLPAPDR